MRASKVYNLFWSLTSNKCKKNQPILASSENANIDNVIMTFSLANNYATYLLAHPHSISTIYELRKSRKFFELSH